MATAIVPDIHVQDSIHEVLNDVDSGRVKTEDFWVQFGNLEVRYAARGEAMLRSDKPTYSALVTAAAKQLDLYQSDRAVGLVRLGDPRATVDVSGRVTTGDVFGSRALVGTDSGELKLLDMLNPELGSIALDGHLLHTSFAGFFPSGQVALSAGMDYSVKLWDLASSSLVQTLRHQKGMVDDIKLIGRGRNLLTLCAKTESVVLWETGKPEVLHEYAIPGVRSLALWSSGPETTGDELPGTYDTNGKVGIAGTDSATVSFDIRSSSRDLHTLADKPSDLVCVSGNHLVRALRETVTALDLRMPNADLYSVKVAPRSRISNIAATPSKVYISTGSATYGYEPTSNAVEVLCCEAQGALAVHSNELWHFGNKIVRHFPL